MKIRTSLVAIAFVAAIATLGACGADASDDAKTPDSTSTDAQVISPVIADVATIDGTTQTLPMDNVLTINVPTDSVADWEATMDPDGIVTFEAGHDDGSATFNPGFKPVKEGSTKVTLHNKSSDETVTFEVDVVAK